MAAVSRLTRQLSEERASVLATEAIELAKSGLLEVSGQAKFQVTLTLFSKPRRGCDKQQHLLMTISMYRQLS